MTYRQPEEWEIPTRQELLREEAEDRLIASYEERYHEFCDRTGLDPEATASVLAYEQEFIEEQDI